MSNELYVNTILNEYVLFVLCFECTDIIGADSVPACQVVQRSMILYCVIISPPFITLIKDAFIYLDNDVSEITNFSCHRGPVFKLEFLKSGFQYLWASFKLWKFSILSFN